MVKIGDIVRTPENELAIVLMEVKTPFTPEWTVFSFILGHREYQEVSLEYLWSTGLCYEAINVIVEAKFFQNRLMKDVITNADNSVDNQQILRDFNVLTLAISQLLSDLGLEDPELRLRDGLRVVMKKVGDESF